ncbi:hypothetical protein FS749_005766 [Ceratobasidium sp. UAMH 11750]|nr:hypothetical protein FS749_005766 [Ceratobasidium sp. UAMH 11750]
MQLRTLASTLLLLPALFANGGPVTVTSPSGVSYLGVRNTTVNQDVFLVIPYAKPPTGAPSVD